ncbi:COG4315 family predicted lipoprotein [Streptomyces ardesiacus]|uniref:COG4315 family predicted lipoprotein n=1 Tax=Streptomyces ardesiacus TaxID=285564 RepID=UPI003657BBF3
MTRIRTATALAAALLVAGAAAGCSDDGGTGAGGTETRNAGTETRNAADAPDADVVPAATSSSAPAVDVKDGTYGKTLVDEKGRTLYLFEKDSKDKSKCDGDCAKAWPPFTVKSTPNAGNGVKKDLLKTIKRDDGSEQVAYNGHPLYRFANDQKPGDTNGQDLEAFGAKWYVINPNGDKVTSKAKTGGGGY